MAETESEGGTKLDAARAAAAAFAERLDLPADRAAVVAFNQRAETVLPLSPSHAAVAAALDALATAPGTRIDLGLEEAGAALSDAGRPGARPVVIVLSDGLHNQAEAPNAAVLAAARRLEAAGALVYAIGLGSDVDGAFLAAVATTPDRYYASPAAADLDAIYRAISVRLACEAP